MIRKLHEGVLVDPEDWGKIVAIIADLAAATAVAEYFGDAGSGDPAAMLDVPELTALGARARALLARIEGEG